MNNHILRDLGRYAGARTYRTYTTAWDPLDQSDLDGSGAVFGDVMAYSPTSSPDGYAVTIDVDGVSSVDTGGAEEQQSYHLDLYVVLQRRWIGDVTNYVNAHAPELVTPGIESLTVIATAGGSVSVDLNPQFTDVDAGDTLTFTVSPDSDDPLPSPLTLVSGVIGTTAPGSDGIHDILVRATDPSGLYSEILVTIIVGNVAVPDVDDPGTTLGAAVAALNAASLTSSVTYADSGSVPVGNVISQSPAPGTLVTPLSVVSLVVSEGGTVVAILPHILRIETARAAPRVITAITSANPPMITSAAHGYVDGDVVYISGVYGMTQLNGRVFTVTGVTTNTFMLKGVDGTVYSNYISGGSAYELTMTDIGAVSEMAAEGGVAVEIEVSHWQSLTKEFLVGVLDDGDVTFSLFLDNADVGQALLRAAQNSSSVKGFTISDGAGKVACFPGAVKRYGFDMAPNGAVEAGVEIKITAGKVWFS